MRHTIALFGESEKGQFQKPYIVHELPQLIDLLGNPPRESEGLFFAIQALLYKRELIYFRVEQEGFSISDYMVGFKYLEKVETLSALCLPGVGDPMILEASAPLSELHKSHLISTEKDLFDYLRSA
jgi:hypothetical protein